MTQDKDVIEFSRNAFFLKLLDRMYKQRNMKKIAAGDKVLIPTEKFPDFVHDLGLIVGKAVADVLNELADKKEEGEKQG